MKECPTGLPSIIHRRKKNSPNEILLESPKGVSRDIPSRISWSNSLVALLKEMSSSGIIQFDQYPMYIDD